MDYFIYLIWLLFATDLDSHHTHVESYCAIYNTEISAIECDVKINSFDEMSDKEFINYVSECLDRKSKMFLLQSSL
jgi:hypothetical protein